MSSKIISTIEANQAALKTQIGQFHGHQAGIADALIAIKGDFVLSLAYASIFFPEIEMRNGSPVGRFATSSEFTPLDCFHIDLLHHTEAAGRSSDLYSALGHVLAEAWNLVLEQKGLSGRFVYDASNGSDVVYKA